MPAHEVHKVVQQIEKYHDGMDDGIDLSAALKKLSLADILQNSTILAFIKARQVEQTRPAIALLTPPQREALTKLEEEAAKTISTIIETLQKNPNKLLSLFAQYREQFLRNKTLFDLAEETYPALPAKSSVPFGVASPKSFQEQRNATDREHQAPRK